MANVRSQRRILLAAMLGATFCVRGADAPPARGKAMKMDAPMTIKMMKPGMKVGDVKKAAEEKDREMKSRMGRESAAAKK